MRYSNAIRGAALAIVAAGIVALDSGAVRADGGARERPGVGIDTGGEIDGNDRGGGLVDRLDRTRDKSARSAGHARAQHRVHDNRVPVELEGGACPGPVVGDLLDADSRLPGAQVARRRVTLKLAGSAE